MISCKISNAIRSGGNTCEAGKRTDDAGRNVRPMPEIHCLRNGAAAGVTPGNMKRPPRLEEHRDGRNPTSRASEEDHATGDAKCFLIVASSASFPALAPLSAMLWSRTFCSASSLL